MKMEIGPILYIIFTEEILTILVALLVNLVVFFIYRKIKDNKHSYLLFNFFPTLAAGIFPEVPFQISQISRHGIREGFKRVIYQAAFDPYHVFFSSILTAWLIIPIVLGIIYLILYLDKARFSWNIRVPRYMPLYVSFICLTTLVIHLYIMDPLGY
jgi:hypothetical protein